MRLGYVGILLLALSFSAASGAGKPIKIVTTFLPIYCFTANVAANAATVENLLPGAVNLHDYQLTPADLRKLSEADLIVINGLGMENFLQRALANSSPGMARKVIQISDGLEQELIEEEGPVHHREAGHEHSRNPHIWLDPKLAMQCVTNILKALQGADPSHAAIYERNAELYITRLQALDEEIARALVPVRDVPFVTYHNAFPYFVRRYRLALLGVVEQVPEVAPSAREISRLLQEIRMRKGKALFTEPGGSTRLAQQIARDAGIPVAELDPIETGSIEAGGYEQAMRKNVASLRKALSP